MITRPSRANSVRLVPPLVVAIPLLLGLTGKGKPVERHPQRSGAEVYRAACASCHGPDGKGMPRHLVGFETELPDFTDCSFVTREPDADWAAVVQHGGPARVFDRMMPAFGDALRPAEVQTALEHVRGFCTERRSWPRGELNLPRPLVTAKAFPEDEAVLSTSIEGKGDASITSKLIYERRLGSRGQLELILPFGVLETAPDDWTAGIGDIGIATKWALLHSLRTGSILSLALELFLPTGREDRDLGKGMTVIEPFLAYGQLLPYDGFLQLQAGAELSTKQGRPHELFWRAVLGMSFAQGGHGRTWSPMVELLGAHEIEDDSPVHWEIVPQMQVTLSRRQHVRIAAGARIPIDNFDSRATRFVVYLLWDWFDGSLFEGW